MRHIDATQKRSIHRSSGRLRFTLGALCGCCIALVVCASPLRLSAQEQTPEQTSEPTAQEPTAQHSSTTESHARPATTGPTFTEITPELRQAVDKGLASLAKLQAEDGSYGGERYGKHVGITALACLAFMADGNLPDRGKYSENVKRGLDFVLDSATPSGLIAHDTSHGPMYGHGFAALFLGEVYGQTGDPRIREVLLKAVRLIVNTQNDEGGWRYHPVPVDADISVTICQIMALRSAQRRHQRTQGNHRQSHRIRARLSEPVRRRVSLHAQQRRLGVSPIGRGRGQPLLCRRV